MTDVQHQHTLPREETVGSFVPRSKESERTANRRESLRAAYIRKTPTWVRMYSPSERPPKTQARTYATRPVIATATEQHTMRLCKTRIVTAQGQEQPAVPLPLQRKSACKLCFHAGGNSQMTAVKAGKETKASPLSKGGLCHQELRHPPCHTLETNQPTKNKKTLTAVPQQQQGDPSPQTPARRPAQSARRRWSALRPPKSPGMSRRFGRGRE